MKPAVTLASGSPRRRKLLEPFFPDMLVFTPDVQERQISPGSTFEEASRIVLDNARRKALSGGDGIIVAADTAVLLDGMELEKTDSRDKAGEMLARLSGKTHDVLTGVVVCHGERMKTRCVHSIVCFRDLSSEDIQSYLEHEEYPGKAGAYAIQGWGADLVMSLEGSWSNVVGLPLGAVSELLLEFGISIDVSSGPVVVVVGMPGAGKEEFVRAARKHLFAVVRMGDVVREYATDMGVDMGDRGVGGFASSQRQEHGDDIWARRTLDRLTALDAYRVVVDGTRSHHEVGVFKQALGERFRLVAVSANSRIRYERLVSRGRSDAPPNFEAFMERENRENSWGISRAMEMADCTIDNEDSLENYRKDAEDFLSRLE